MLDFHGIVTGIAHKSSFEERYCRSVHAESAGDDRNGIECVHRQSGISVETADRIAESAPTDDKERTICENV